VDVQTKRLMQKFSVPYEYPVYFTTAAFSPENTTLVEVVSSKESDRRHRLLVVLDRSIAEANPDLRAQIAAYAAHHRDRIELACDPVLVDGGEAVKNTSTIATELQICMNDRGMDRQSYVVIIGGGALQDMAGYAAATAHRGLRVVRLPTTVLGQADSGVGVKNGINLFGKKNFVGTFAPPFAVINDSALLTTLSRRDMIAGMAEAVKVSLIRDQAFFTWLREHARKLAACDPEAMSYLIERSAEIHLRHIGTSGDPFEYGSARPLDFGHWAAHKLESLTNHRLRHGEAVAIGVALDTRYSAEVGLLGPREAEAVVSLLEQIGFYLWDEAFEYKGADGRPRVFEGLVEFREHLGGRLTVTLLAGLGRGVEVHEIDDDAMLRSMEWLRQRATLVREPRAVHEIAATV
jgi:3-dehydroquinate synthase